MLILTNFATVNVSEAEMALSGAKWNAKGHPVNLNAKLLMDFMEHATFEEWLFSNAVKA